MTPPPTHTHTYMWTILDLPHARSGIAKGDGHFGLTDGSSFSVHLDKHLLCAQ